MGFWGSVGNVAKWAVPGYAQYRAGKAVVGKVYNDAYGNAAREQTGRIQQGADRLRQTGTIAASEFGRRGQTAINRFDRAGGAATDYTMNRPSYSASQYSQAQGRYASPTNSQSFYNSYRPTSIAQSRLQSRPQVPMRLEGELGSLRSFANGQTTSGGLMESFQDRYGQTDALDSRTDERRAFANQPTNTSSALDAVNKLDPTANTRDAFGLLSNRDVSRFSSGYGDQVRSGSTQGGQMLTDLRSGSNAGGRFSSYLTGPNSESGRAMEGFDPSKTAGLGETYSKLAAEGPTYEEDFYTSQRDGTNPAYEMLKNDAQKQARASAAARGGFVSGKAIENEGRVTSRLAAEEFARRGDLAAKAGDARRSRLGQQLEGATALDNQLLGQRKLGADVALGREGMLSDQAISSDSIRGNLAGQQDQMLGDISMHQDVQDLSKLQTMGDLSKSMDAGVLEKSRQRLEGSGQEDTLLRNDQDAIDSLTMKGTDRDLAQDRNLTDLGISDDSARTNRMSSYANSLGTVDTNNLQQQRDIDTLTGKASDEATEGARIGGEAAGRADTQNMARDTNLAGLAKDATQEQRDYYKDRFDQALALGDKQAIVQQAYDMAQIGAMTSSEIAAIDAEMAAAGIEPAARQAFVNNAMQLGGLLAKAS